MITNPRSGTNVHEIADGIYRINTPVALSGAGTFNFNQYLIHDDRPLLFHTGPRRLFPLVRVPVASRVGAMVSLADFADRPPRALADGETLSLGRHSLSWIDTPHVPHGWDCGLMMDAATGTFLCGDLFTQGGPGDVPLTESDILGPSEAFRKPMDYFAHAPETRAILERLARLAPTTLACMHGSAWRGDGAALIRALADRLG